MVERCPKLNLTHGCPKTWGRFSCWATLHDQVFRNFLRCHRKGVRCGHPACCSTWSRTPKSSGYPKSIHSSTFSPWKCQGYIGLVGCSNIPDVTPIQNHQTAPMGLLKPNSSGGSPLFPLMASMRSPSVRLPTKRNSGAASPVRIVVQKSPRLSGDPMRIASQSHDHGILGVNVSKHSIHGAMLVDIPWSIWVSIQIREKKTLFLMKNNPFGCGFHTLGPGPWSKSASEVLPMEVNWREMGPYRQAVLTLEIVWNHYQTPWNKP